ncbi:unnamed protein product, partial [Effrenium voratum]
AGWVHVDKAGERASPASPLQQQDWGTRRTKADSEAGREAPTPDRVLKQPKVAAKAKKNEDARDAWDEARRRRTARRRVPAAQELEALVAAQVEANAARSPEAGLHQSSAWCQGPSDRLAADMRERERARRQEAVNAARARQQAAHTK